MTLHKRVTSWLSSKVAVLRPFAGTRYEQDFQRIVAQSGWPIDGFDNDRVYFPVLHNGCLYRACIALQPDGLASACVLGRVAVLDAILDDTRSLFDGFNANPQRPFVHSLLPHSDRYRHAVTWTTKYSQFDAVIVRKKIPDLVLSCACTDQFALDMYELGLMQESNMTDVERRDPPNSISD